MDWKKSLLTFAGVTSDEVTKKEDKREGYKGKDVAETPLPGEFTGDKFPKSGDPVKHEQSDWKGMNEKFKSQKSQGEPKATPDKTDFGSPLSTEKGIHVEKAVKHEELGKGAEPTYVTGAKRQPLFRLGSKFSALRSDASVTINGTGTWGTIQKRLAGTGAKYLDPKNRPEPESANLVVVAYTDNRTGKAYVAKVTDFFAAFVPMEKRSHKLDDAAVAMIKSDLQEINANFQKYLAYDEPQYLLTAKTLCEQLAQQFSEAAMHHGTPQLDESELAISSSRKEAKSPPHSEYTMHELKKSPKVDNPWALGNWMENEGYELHDTKPKDKKKKKSTWQRMLSIFSTEGPPPKGQDEFPTGGKGDKDSWTNEMLDVAKIMDKDCTRDKHYAYKEAFEGAAPPFGSPEREDWEKGRKTTDGESKPEDTEKTANVYLHCPHCGHQADSNDFVRPGQDFANRKATCPRCGKSFEMYEEGDAIATDRGHQEALNIIRNRNAGKRANVDVTKKPDGTISINVEEGPEPSTLAPAAVPPVAAQNSATPVTTPAATKGKSTTTSLVGQTIRDPKLGMGKVVSQNGNTVIANFASGTYETTVEKLMVSSNLSIQSA